MHRIERFTYNNLLIKDLIDLILETPTRSFNIVKKLNFNVLGIDILKQFVQSATLNNCIELLLKYLPMDYIIIKFINEPNINTVKLFLNETNHGVYISFLIKCIPKEYITTEYMHLFISSCREDTLDILLKNIPENLLSYEFFNILIDACTENILIKVIESIPKNIFNKKLFIFIINKTCKLPTYVHLSNDLSKKEIIEACIKNSSLDFDYLVKIITSLSYLDNTISINDR
jgi:hypothetical protein